MRARPRRTPNTPPETQYVNIGDGDVTYQILGESPRDLLFCSALGGHVDLVWQIPQAAEFFQKVATFRRDLRGVPGTWKLFAVVVG